METHPIINVHLPTGMATNVFRLGWYFLRAVRVSFAAPISHCHIIDMAQCITCLASEMTLDKTSFPFIHDGSLGLVAFSAFRLQYPHKMGWNLLRKTHDLNDKERAKHGYKIRTYTCLENDHFNAFDRFIVSDALFLVSRLRQ